MKLKKISPDFTVVIKYLLYFLSITIFNHLEKTFMPYSVAILLTAIFSDMNAIVCSIIYIFSFIIFGENGLFLFGAISSLIFCIVYFIYKKLHIKPRYEIIVFAMVGMAIFCVIGNKEIEISINHRIFVSVITVFLSLICQTFYRAVSIKGLKYKLTYEELSAVALVCVLFGIGISNALSPYVWKTISIFIILMVSFAYKKGFAITTSTILGISLAIYYTNVNYASCFLILGLVSESFMPVSRFLSGIMVIFADFVIEFFFAIYGAYTLSEFLPCLIGTSIFFLIPTVFLKNLKEKLYTFREKQLTRVSINRNRVMLSNRLYELSGVFLEMSEAFSSFKKHTLTEEKAKQLIISQLTEKACLDCEHNIKCKRHSDNFNYGLSKFVDVGFAKGKLSLIDLPTEISEVCIHPNNVLFCINKLLADFRGYMIDNANVENGRILLSKEALGVSEILKELALESGALLKYHSRLERELSRRLFNLGFAVSELLIYGEDQRISVGIILTMKEFDEQKICSVLSNTLKINMKLVEKLRISDEKCYLNYKKCAEFDAIFGISQVKKDGSTHSGDTHSLTRLLDDRFLVALSDGMGSGDDAFSLSSTSLSLIESFYKAGMHSDLILETVNKLMAINSKDSYTALDVCVIDLKNCSADFIKYGAPYGFILSANGIRMVEGSSLPLGILDDLKPSVCNTQLNDGDVIVLMTDGIADAFSSSVDLLEFLRTEPAKNPQSLSDNILRKALELTFGKKNDDMSVLAVRIFKH